jgi:exodeoxyribonuclease VII large subunit
VGHEIDVTLADLAADVRALTPSEAAERVAPAMDEITHALRQYARRANVALQRRAAASRAALEALRSRRVLRKPFDRVHDLARRLDELQGRSDRAARRRIVRGRERLASLSARLEALSPLAVLGRGYSLTQRADDGALVRDADSLAAGERIVTRFARGRAVSSVEGTFGNEEAGQS